MNLKTIVMIVGGHLMALTMYGQKIDNVATCPTPLDINHDCGTVIIDLPSNDFFRVTGTVTGIEVDDAGRVGIGQGVNTTKSLTVKGDVRLGELSTLSDNHVIFGNVTTRVGTGSAFIVEGTVSRDYLLRVNEGSGTRRVFIGDGNPSSGPDINVDFTSTGTTTIQVQDGVQEAFGVEYGPGGSRKTAFAIDNNNPTVNEANILMGGINSGNEIFLRAVGSYDFEIGDQGSDDEFRIDYQSGAGGNAVLVDKDGNVGINNTTPSANLDVVGTLQYVDGNQANGYVLTSDASGNATWQAASGSAGPTGPTGPQGPAGPQGPTGPTYTPPCTTDNRVIIGDGTNLDCSTLLWDNGTFVGVNTSTVITAGYELHVESGSTTGDGIIVNGDVATTLGSNLASDQNLKTAIRSYSNALEDISQLNIHEYLFRNDEFSQLHLPKGDQIGVLAQELEMVFPNLVKTMTINPEKTNGELSEIKMVNYDALIPVAIAAIQEQQTIIEDQKAEIEDLNNRLARVEALLLDNGGAVPAQPKGASLNNGLESYGSLEQNIPNPFAESTVIKYTLSKATRNASIVLMDIEGRKILDRKLEIVERGTVEINLEAMKGGIYFYSLVVDGNIVATKPMIKL